MKPPVSKMRDKSDTSKCESGIARMGDNARPNENPPNRIPKQDDLHLFGITSEIAD